MCEHHKVVGLSWLGGGVSCHCEPKELRCEFKYATKFFHKPDNVGNLLTRFDTCRQKLPWQNLDLRGGKCSGYIDN